MTVTIMDKSEYTYLPKKKSPITCAVIAILLVILPAFFIWGINNYHPANRLPVRDYEIKIQDNMSLLAWEEPGVDFDGVSAGCSFFSAENPDPKKDDVIQSVVSYYGKFVVIWDFIIIPRVYVWVEDTSCAGYIPYNQLE